jgi:hypothetical protein
MYNDAIIHPALTDIVNEAAAADKHFIADLIFPPLASKKVRGNFRKNTKKSSGIMRADVTRRAPGTRYGSVDSGVEKDTFECVDRGLMESLDDTIEKEYEDEFDAGEYIQTKLLANIKRAREIIVAGQAQNKNNFDFVKAKVPYTGTNLAEIEAAIDLKDSLKRIMKRGEPGEPAVVMNRDVFDRMCLSEKLATFLFGKLGGGQMITPELLSQKFNADFIVADATVDTSDAKSPKAPAGPFDYIWKHDYIFVGLVQDGPLSAGGVGRTIFWTGDTGGQLYVTETIPEGIIRSKHFIVRCNTDEKIVNASAGTLIELDWE